MGSTKIMGDESLPAPTLATPKVTTMSPSTSSLNSRKGENASTFLESRIPAKDADPVGSVPSSLDEWLSTLYLLAYGPGSNFSDTCNESDLTVNGSGLCVRGNWDWMDMSFDSKSSKSFGK
jgi:hypothetical protein